MLNLMSESGHLRLGEIPGPSRLVFYPVQNGIACLHIGGTGGTSGKSPGTSFKIC